MKKKSGGPPGLPNDSLQLFFILTPAPTHAAGARGKTGWTYVAPLFGTVNAQPGFFTRRSGPRHWAVRSGHSDACDGGLAARAFIHSGHCQFRAAHREESQVGSQTRRCRAE